MTIDTAMRSELDQAPVANPNHALRRVCFQLQVRPELIAEYRQRHAAVWPEMLRALREAGWHNYSLFLREDGLLIGYLETRDLTAAQAAMAATDVNTRWQTQMSDFFVDLDGAPDAGFTQLTEVFNLDDSLAALDPPPTNNTPTSIDTRTPDATPTKGSHS